jgi:hypothetical protein
MRDAVSHVFCLNLLTFLLLLLLPLFPSLSPKQGEYPSLMLDAVSHLLARLADSPAAAAAAAAAAASLHLTHTGRLPKPDAGALPHLFGPTC